MAFNPRGVNYQQLIDAEYQGMARLEQANQRKREREAEIKRQKRSKRSPFQKLVSAGLRGAAAYYTGGLSEKVGGGQLIDKVALGEGAERNEYGDLVGLGSAVATGMSEKSAQDAAGKLATQDRSDQQMMSFLSQYDPKSIPDFLEKKRKTDLENQQTLSEYRSNPIKSLFDSDPTYETPEYKQYYDPEAIARMVAEKESSPTGVS